VIRPIKLKYDTKLQFLLYLMLSFVYDVLHARLVKYSTIFHLCKLQYGEWLGQKSAKLIKIVLTWNKESGKYSLHEKNARVRCNTRVAGGSG